MEFGERRQMMCGPSGKAAPSSISTAPTGLRAQVPRLESYVPRGVARLATFGRLAIREQCSISRDELCAHVPPLYSSPRYSVLWDQQWDELWRARIAAWSR